MIYRPVRIKIKFLSVLSFTFLKCFLCVCTASILYTFYNYFIEILLLIRERVVVELTTNNKIPVEESLVFDMVDENGVMM